MARLYFTMMDRRKGAFSFNKDNLSPRYRGERAALRVIGEVLTVAQEDGGRQGPAHARA